MVQVRMRRDSNVPPATPATTNSAGVFKTVRRRTVTVTITETVGTGQVPVDEPSVAPQTVPKLIPEKGES
jgi:hypothetical protein